MSGKKYQGVLKAINRDQLYSLTDACVLLESTKTAKFDESVEVALRLGVDAKQSDQVVRGASSLPHGLGKTVRILVFAKGEKEKEAKAAGADFVGAEDLVEKIQTGWMDFDKVIATPDMMVLVSKIGKLLGPRGLMSNPKVGTVTFDVAKAVKENQAGKVEFRTEKAGIVQAAVGKLSFGGAKIRDNVLAFIDEVIKLKPATSKGTYLRSVTLSSTMGPGIKVDPTSIHA